jgi:hypothetical protein
MRSQDNYCLGGFTLQKVINILQGTVAVCSVGYYLYIHSSAYPSQCMYTIDVSQLTGILASSGNQSHISCV